MPNKQVIRISKFINLRILFWWNTYFSERTSKEICDNQVKEFILQAKPFLITVCCVFQPPAKTKPLLSDKRRLSFISIIPFRSVSLAMYASVINIIVFRNSYAELYSAHKVICHEIWINIISVTASFQNLLPCLSKYPYLSSVRRCTRKNIRCLLKPFEVYV